MRESSLMLFGILRFIIIHVLCVKVCAAASLKTMSREILGGGIQILRVGGEHVCATMTIITIITIITMGVREERRKGKPGTHPKSSKKIGREGRYNVSVARLLCPGESVYIFV